MTTRYRADVDGLRALAVGLVVAFHAFPATVTAGYVGVDVFFVISGYLVTGILLADDGARMAPLAFWVRRANRIFPALILVLIAVLLAGWFLLFAHEYRSLGKHVGAAAGFFTNIALFGEAGYFDGASEAKPLLHLWSLAVEEQFYIVWPIWLMIAARTRIGLRGGIVGLVVASFLANLACAAISPVGDFYLPVFRFWEMAAGGLLALRRAPTRLDAVVGRFGAPVGVAAIFAAALLLPRGIVYPGLWAALPVVGAMLVLASDPRAAFNRRLLAAPPAVHLGVLSYPLYLWHWPLLSLGRIVTGEPLSPVLAAGLVVAALAASEATWRWVERPFRVGRGRRDLALALVLTLAAVGAAGGAVYGARGLPGRAVSAYLPATTEGWEPMRQITCEPALAARWDLDLCVHPRDGRVPRVVFHGDSHAWRLFQAMHARLPDGSVAMLGHTGRGIETADPTPFLAAAPGVDQTVVLTWEVGNLDEATATARVAALVAAGRRVVLVVDNPRLPRSVIDCIGRPLRPAVAGGVCTTDEAAQRARLEPQRRLFARLRATAPDRIAVVETLDLFCTGGRCGERDPATGAFLYDDEAHLSFVAARAVIDRLVATAGLPGGSAPSR